MASHQVVCGVQNTNFSCFSYRLKFDQGLLEAQNYQETPGYAALITGASRGQTVRKRIHIPEELRWYRSLIPGHKPKYWMVLMSNTIATRRIRCA